MILSLQVGCAAEDDPAPEDESGQSDSPDMSDPGQQAPDDNQPGEGEDVDLDGDGEGDIQLSPDCDDPLAAFLCDEDTLLGIDIDCDGQVDLGTEIEQFIPCTEDLPDPPPGPSASTCQTNVNGQGADCVSEDGVTYNCECLENGQVVNVCTDTENACSYPAGCCFQ